MYAWNYSKERKELWADLKDHHDSPLFRNKSWMLCGDFNKILEGEEHSSSSNAHLNFPGIRDFQEIVGYCSLQDLGSQGPLFTWCNKRDEGLLCKMLDRVLIIEEWMERFPHAYSVFEAGGCSDHLRGRIMLEAATGNTRKPFKFSNVLTRMPQFVSTVERSCETTVPLFVSTSSSFRLSKKYKSLKPALGGLGREHLGDISRKAKEAYTELCTK